MNDNNKQFKNIDERYGNPELCDISDLQELNPEGIFEEDTDGIYELINDEWELVAERIS